MPPSAGAPPLPQRRSRSCAGTLLLGVAISIDGGSFGPGGALAPPAAHAGGPPIGEDLRAYAQPRTLAILGTGTAFAAAAALIENPTKESTFLEAKTLDGPSDVGNEYGAGTTLVAISGLLYGAGHFTHDAALRYTGGEMMRALAYSTVAVSALKVAVHRTRPNGGAYSFPSGHTTVAFAMAPILAKNLGWHAALPAYALAGATGMGRMEDRKHYLSDVVFGAALGLSIGVAVSGHDALPARLDLEATPDGAAVAYHF